VRVPAARGHPSAPIPPRSVPGGPATVVIVAITNGNVTEKIHFRAAAGADAIRPLIYFISCRLTGSLCRVEARAACAANSSSQTPRTFIQMRPRPPSITLNFSTLTHPLLLPTFLPHVRPTRPWQSVRPSVSNRPRRGRVPPGSPIPCPVVPGAQR